jgi:hypothetical protein
LKLAENTADKNPPRSVIAAKKGRTAIMSGYDFRSSWEYEAADESRDIHARSDPFREDCPDGYEAVADDTYFDYDD